MAKVRVYELAKELGVDSKDLLQTLNDMGEFVRSASSTINASVVSRLRQNLLGSARTGQRSPHPVRSPAPAISSSATYGDRGIKMAARPADPRQPATPHHGAVDPAPGRTGGSSVLGDAPQALAIAVDVVLRLHPVEIDAVELAHSDHPEFRLRIDKLDDEKNPYWMSVWVSDRTLPIPGAWMRLRKWRLPLKPLDAPERYLPGLGVLQFATEQAVGQSAEMIAAQMLGRDAASAKLSVEECSPAEANRRYGITALVHRRHGNGGRKRFAETTCLKCGLPLSDPTSVALGIGPECRRQMGQDAIRALAVPTGSSRSIILGAQKPATWVGVVQRRFAEIRRCRSASDARLLREG